jgi:hypothetical protein
MNRKINLNRPEVSAEEIAKRKNFDSVLKANVKVSKPLIKKPWFLSSIVVATVAIVTTAVLLNKNNVNQTTSNTTVNDSLALEKFYKTEEAKPCIAPPIEGLNIPYTTYKVMAENGGTFEFKTGSTFTVPKNAFADQNGTIIKGEVEIRYREFHDMVDVFVAGIPMTYDSAGTQYHFESAGMLEMLAYQNGKEVGMAKDKSVTIEMASNDANPKHNLYLLDTVQNNWACLGKDKIVKPTKSTENFNSDVPVKFNETPEYKSIETKKEEAKIIKEEKIAALPKVPAEPKKPAKVNASKFTFNIDVNPKEFPELAVYKGVLFEVGDENKSFTANMYDITWDAATIKSGTKKDVNYLLTLQKGSKKYDLVVYPVFEGKNHETAMKAYQEKFDKHETVLEKRQADEKKIEVEYLAKVAEYKKNQLELERKWKAAQDEEFKSLDTEQKVKRVFAINNFGVYNCDNPHAYPTGVVCIAKLNNDIDKKLEIYDVFLVEKGLNAMFTYSRNPVVKFSFDPKAKNILWTVEHGKLYYLKPEDFNNFKNGIGTSEIKMHAVQQKFANAEEMKAFFEI